jgi:hypothetical protein
MADSDAELAAQINKRLSLNLLIQGCAEHAFLTSHHLVRDELNALDERLLPLYDRFAIAGFAQYWFGDAAILFGRPERFWQRCCAADHPFRAHPLLSRHGRALADSARRRAHQRCRSKRVTTWRFLFGLQVAQIIAEIFRLERPHLAELTDLAKRVTTEIWKIPGDRLDARITRDPRFGVLSPANTFQALLLRASAAGYGGVLRGDEQLRVVARGWNWSLLCHELVKGTAELICLHGLNTLDDQTYAKVIAATDRIEYEPWMLPTGAELWRRILALLPRGASLAHVLMHLARLSPSSLHALLNAVMEDPPWARELLEHGVEM